MKTHSSLLPTLSFLGLLAMVSTGASAQHTTQATMPASSRGYHAPSYVQTIVVSDVAVQYVRGQLRFCERASVRGLICEGQPHGLARKSRPMPRDWWHPHTYIAALTGRSDALIEAVGPGPMPDSLAISFRFP